MPKEDVKIFSSPEKTLVYAIISRAVWDIGRLEKEARGGLDWILSDREDYPFSFVRCCYYLGTDPEWLRAMILHRTQNH